MTLIETTLVIATIVLMMGLALPAVKSLVHSFQSEGGTKGIIHAALNSARTMAATHQRYVGVRFQKACISDDPANPLKGELNAPQYMIFIVHDEPKNMGGLANGFKAMEGHEPIKLPDTVGVMSLNDVTDILRVDLRRAGALSDVTTFSIVFSPSGKLIVHDVRVRNRDGVYMPVDRTPSARTSRDDIFNSVENICRYGQGMFIQDDYAALKNISTAGDPGFIELGLGKEPSVTSFVIYDTAIVRARYTAPRPGPAGLYDYLNALRKDKAVYVSPYTGDLVSSD